MLEINMIALLKREILEQSQAIYKRHTTRPSATYEDLICDTVNTIVSCLCDNLGEVDARMDMQTPIVTATIGGSKYRIGISSHVYMKEEPCSHMGYPETLISLQDVIFERV